MRVAVFAEAALGAGGADAEVAEVMAVVLRVKSQRVPPSSSRSINKNENQNFVQCMNVNLLKYNFKDDLTFFKYKCKIKQQHSIQKYLKACKFVLNFYYVAKLSTNRHLYVIYNILGKYVKPSNIH